MKLLRRAAAILMVAAALFIAGGIALAPPSIGAAIVLAVMAGLMLLGAFFVWPRSQRPWQIDALINGR